MPVDSPTRPSLWLDELPQLDRRPALSSDIDADVVIVGGGFSGLWTCYYLLEHDPSLDIVLLEAEYVGFGASGRNGGWVSSGMSLSPATLVSRHGPAAARAVIDTMRAAVEEVGRVASTESIDCDHRATGILLLARGTGQTPSLRESYDVFRLLDRDDGVRWLEADEARKAVGATRVEAAVSNRHGAAVQPAKLARGLADVVERRGARVFETTPVVEVKGRSSGRRPRATTSGGVVRADTVLLATEAWTSRLPGMRRSVLPVYSLIVATEPIPDASWDQIGWAGRESVASYPLTVDYLTRTPDDRILFGGRGAPYHYGSRVRPGFDAHPPTHDRLRRSVVEWWPHLDGIGFTHAWGGPLAITRDFTPNVGHDPATGIARAYGYVGQGLATTNVAGRLTAASIAGKDSGLPPLPFAAHRSRRWEPEPLRWLGARYVQRSFERLDRKAEVTGRPPSGRSLAERLFDH